MQSVYTKTLISKNKLHKDIANQCRNIATGLPNLQYVWLPGTPIENLAPLGSLPGLVSLGFDSGFRDLPFLKNLTKLVELRLDACRCLPPGLSLLKQLDTFGSLGGTLEDISLLA